MDQSKVLFEEANTDERLPPEIIAACKNNFRYFCKYIIHQKVGAFHEEIINDLEGGDQNLLVMASRGHFKTWIVSRAFPLWEMWRQNKKKLTIGLQTSNVSQSKYILDLSIREIEHNPYLRDVLYPKDIYHATWSALRIHTENGHEFMVQPFGRKGFHYDYLLSDDLQQESDTAGSSISIDAIKRTFWSASAPMTNTRRGKHIVVGTPIALDDLYSEFNNKPKWKVLKFPAVITKPDGTWDSPQFPEHFSLKDLEEMRDNMPPWSWQTEYMLNPVGTGTVVFPSDLISASMNPTYPLPTPQQQAATQYFAGWDVAFSDATSADYSAVIALRRTPGCPLRVVTNWRDKVGEERQFDKVRELNSQFQFTKLVIEEKGQSYSMAEKAAKDYTLAGSIEKFDTSHKNKEKIIGDLRLVMQNGGLDLAGDMKISRELGSFGIVTKDGTQTFRAMSGHDDLVMALAMAVYAAGGWVPKKRPAGGIFFAGANSTPLSATALSSEFDVPTGKCPKCKQNGIMTGEASYYDQDEEKMRKHFLCRNCGKRWSV